LLVLGVDDETLKGMMKARMSRITHRAARMTQRASRFMRSSRKGKASKDFDQSGPRNQSVASAGGFAEDGHANDSFRIGSNWQRDSEAAAAHALVLLPDAADADADGKLDLLIDDVPREKHQKPINTVSSWGKTVDEVHAIKSLWGECYPDDDGEDEEEAEDSKSEA
jgi:hypothetical protein